MIQFDQDLNVRHSRMFLAGIQAIPDGPPLRTFGGDDLKITRTAEL
jgi:hypothetical protein